MRSLVWVAWVGILLLSSPGFAQLPETTGDRRPVPDPTVLTTQQLYREMASLRAIIETRLDASDKALVLLRAMADRLPSEMDARIAQLQALHGERFRSIEHQFTSTKQALDAALQASEKSANEKNILSALAISKAEAQATKQIEQLNELSKTIERTLDDKIRALKERQDRLEGQASGISVAWMAVIGLFGLISIGASVFAAIRVGAHAVKVG